MVETNGKWYVAGPREGETREEVDNLDPGMNDPLPLGTRGIPLSRRVALHPLLRASCAPSTLYSSRRGDDSAGIRSSLSRSTPFHSLFAHHPLVPPFLAL